MFRPPYSLDLIPIQKKIRNNQITAKEDKQKIRINLRNLKCIWFYQRRSDTVVVKKKYKFDKKKYKSGQKKVQVGQKKVQVRTKKSTSRTKKGTN